MAKNKFDWGTIHHPHNLKRHLSTVRVVRVSTLAAVKNSGLETLGKRLDYFNELTVDPQIKKWSPQTNLSQVSAVVCGLRMIFARGGFFLDIHRVYGCGATPYGEPLQFGLTSPHGGEAAVFLFQYELSEQMEVALASNEQRICDEAAGLLSCIDIHSFSMVEMKSHIQSGAWGNKEYDLCINPAYREAGFIRSCVDFFRVAPGSRVPIYDVPRKTCVADVLEAGSHSSEE